MSDAYRDLVASLQRGVVQPEDAGESTRRRIQRTLARSRRPRRARLVLALLAATLALSTAFALYLADARHGARVRPAPRAGVRAASPVPRPAALDAGASDSAAEPDVARASRPSAAPVEADLDVGAASNPNLESGVRPLPRRARMRRELSSGRAARAPSAAPDAAPSPVTPAAKLATEAGAGQAPAAPPTTPAQRHALYIEAHRLHFGGAPQRALEAWDAFLATQPSGTLRLEASFNRALVLARLGLRAEARAALEPFASGAHAGFRQAEARQLLQQLGRP
jgi:hypothetical protein